MLLALNFSALLASLLLIASVTEAAPLPVGAGVITLPLRSIQKPNDDVHPLVYYQQHANKANRRLARMTGRAEPSHADLTERLHKRLYYAAKGPATNWKRYQASAKAAEALAALRGAKANKPTTAPISAARHRGGNRQNVNGTADAATGATGATGAAGSAGIDPKDVEAAIQGGLTKANDPKTQNSLGLDIEANDVGYIATLQIGNPPRDFRTLMDSGSADFWVGAEGCQSDDGSGACAASHTFLGAKSSSSFVDTKKPFKVTYGSGQVSGTKITDDVTIAGLALPKHAFGVADVESVQFSSDQTDFDGLVGLAQSTLSEQAVPTPPEALATAGLIKAPITSYKISRLSDGKNDGEISFGGLDPTKFDAQSLVTVPNVNQQGFWEASVDAVTLDGQDLGLNGRTAILDTGTTLIIAPTADADAIHAAIPGAKSDGQGGFTIPCTSTSVLSLSFGGQQFDINPKDLTFLPVDQNDLQGDCVSGISAGQIGGAQEWLVGDVFLKNAYFSHDVSQNTVSLAKLV